jgi:hydroxyacylglutathione hydrolase
MIKIEQIPVLESNYALILTCSETGETALVDAAPSEEIERHLVDNKINPTKIFVTHHHWDHTDGIAALRKRFDLTVYAPKEEQKDFAYFDVAVTPGDKVPFGANSLETIFCPGHTYGHIAYFEPNQKLLLAGDALFSLGCGRMFDGPAEAMWAGLERLRALPDDTQLYCGHEYTLSNGAFALSVDGNNQALKKRVAEADAQRATNQPTLPTTMGEEKRANPFLRADDPALQKAMNTEGQPTYKTFAALRAAKDQF